MSSGCQSGGDDPFTTLAGGSGSQIAAASSSDWMICKCLQMTPVHIKCHWYLIYKVTHFWTACPPRNPERAKHQHPKKQKVQVQEVQPQQESSSDEEHRSSINAVNAISLFEGRTHRSPDWHGPPANSPHQVLALLPCDFKQSHGGHWDGSTGAGGGLRVVVWNWVKSSHFGTFYQSIIAKCGRVATDRCIEKLVSGQKIWKNSNFFLKNSVAACQICWKTHIEFAAPWDFGKCDHSVYKRSFPQPWPKTDL